MPRGRKKKVVESIKDNAMQKNKPIDERVIKTLVLTNTTSSDKIGFKKLVFSDEDDNRYEYHYNANSNKFRKSVIDFEYMPSLLKDKKFINIAFRIVSTKYNPIGGKYIYNMAYPKFLGISINQPPRKKN